MAITKEQVFNAADELLAADKKPTLAAIGGRIGGSYTTISPWLNEWKERKKVSSKPTLQAAPAAIRDRVDEITADLWAAALDSANARLTTERKVLDEARETANADRAEALEMADKLTGEVEALLATVADLKAECGGLRVKVDEACAAAAMEKARGDTAQARAEEIERRADVLQSELTRAHDEAKQANAEARQARTEAQALREDAARLAGMLAGRASQEANDAPEDTGRLAV